MSRVLEECRAIQCDLHHIMHGQFDGSGTTSHQLGQPRTRRAWCEVAGDGAKSNSGGTPQETHAVRQRHRSRSRTTVVGGIVVRH